MEWTSSCFLEAREAAKLREEYEAYKKDYDEWSMLRAKQNEHMLVEFGGIGRSAALIQLRFRQHSSKS